MLARLISSRELYGNYLVSLETKKSRSGKIQYVDINFVCLSSYHAFQRLKSCGIRTMIFASGTLNEEEFKDTGLHFVNCFQKENHLEQDKVRTFLLKKYRKGNMRGEDVPLKITTNHQQEHEVV